MEITTWGEMEAGGGEDTGEVKSTDPPVVSRGPNPGVVRVSGE